MIEKIRQQLFAFLKSDKDVPVLAGFSVGIYMFLLLYSRNLGMYNSLVQLLFYSCYYILMPVTVLFLGCLIIEKLKFVKFKKQFLFAGVLCFFLFFIIQNNDFGFSKKIALAASFVVVAILSFFFKKYYKIAVVLLLFMAVLNIPSVLASVAVITFADKGYSHPTDDIEAVKFKNNPNIYYIQPDGYASFDNLKNKLHGYDNSAYEDFLSQNGFTMYGDYRSNYASTLLSNSATFLMKHHYAANDIELFNARGIIVGDNPVLRILKNNGYKSHFITENPYLLLNRPKLGYDTTNIPYSEIPFLGGVPPKDVCSDLKARLDEDNRSCGHNFYFIEKFLPSHIHNNKPESLGAEVEKSEYFKRLNEMNLWLKELISFIMAKDKNAMIIIGADHGGFVGYDYMGQSFEKRTSDRELVKSIFGAQLAIRWTTEKSREYDTRLKTGINLFRTVFSFLSEDKKYLDNMQENSSFMRLENNKGVYKYIGENGNVVFEKI